MGKPTGYEKNLESTSRQVFHGHFRYEGIWAQIRPRGMWRGGRRPIRPAAMIWASLGPQEYDSGLYTALNVGDGTWRTTRIAGHDAIYTDRFGASPGSYRVFTL